MPVVLVNLQMTVDLRNIELACCGAERGLFAMDIRLLRKPPPTLVERILGRHRARLVRRRLGLAALGVGVALLRPKPGYRATALVAAVAAAAVLIAVATTVLPIR